MIDAYRAGFPATGSLSRQGPRWPRFTGPRKSRLFFPDATVPGNLVNVDFMVKDSKRFADGGGWGYAVFDYESRPIHSSLAPKPVRPRKGTTPNAASRATPERGDRLVFTEYGSVHRQNARHHQALRPMVPSTSRTGYTFNASLAGPLITAPVVMSNREPWHWHMIVIPTRRPPESGHASGAAGAEIVERVEAVVYAAIEMRSLRSSR